MTKHPSYRARDQPESGSASQHRKDKIMHKFEKRDAKSRTLVILAVVGLAAALTVGIFTAVRMIRKPAQSKDDPKNGIVYDDSAIEGGWDNLSPEEIAEKLNEKVAEGMINISMNTAPYFEDGKAEGNVMIVNESINNYPQQVEFIRNDTGEQIYQSKAIPVGSKIVPAGHTNARLCSTDPVMAACEDEPRRASLRGHQAATSQFGGNCGTDKSKVRRHDFTPHHILKNAAEGNVMIVN